MGHLRHRSLQVQELETTVLFADQEGDLDSAEQFFWSQLDHLRSFSLLVGTGAWLLWGLSWDVLCLFHVVSPSRGLARLVCAVTEEFSAMREREHKPQGTGPFMLLLVILWLMFHWPKLIAWPSSVSG